MYFHLQKTVDFFRKMDTNDTHFDGLRHTESNQQEECIDSEESYQQMQITDLIQEFLEQIFMYLDLPGLTRAADVCSQFRKATKLPFKRKYAQKLVEFSDAPKSNELYHMEDGHLTITNLKIGFSALRCFGDTITQIKFINPNHSTKFCILFMYVDIYCGKSLTMLSMDYSFALLFKGSRRFSNVQHFCMSEMLWGDNSKGWDLGKVFPQLRRLTLERMASMYAAGHLPNLEELTIDRSGDHFGFYVPETLRLNPQIRKFTTNFSDTIFNSFVDNCVPLLRFIQELDLTYKHCREPWFRVMSGSTPFFNCENKINLPNVRKLTLSLIYEDEPMPQIPFQCNQLTHFILDGNFLQSDAFDAFIKRHTKIARLCLMFKFPYYFLDELKLISASLPTLEEISLLPSNELFFSVHFIIGYLNDFFESVNRCIFYCCEPKHVVEVACCCTKWNVQIIPHNNTLSLIKLTRTN